MNIWNVKFAWPASFTPPPKNKTKKNKTTHPFNCMDWVFLLIRRWVFFMLVIAMTLNYFYDVQKNQDMGKSILIVISPNGWLWYMTNSRTSCTLISYQLHRKDRQVFLDQQVHRMSSVTIFMAVGVTNVTQFIHHMIPLQFILWLLHFCEFWHFISVILDNALQPNLATHSVETLHANI